MSLQFLIGRSGSGKTHTIYQMLIEESIKEEDQNYFLIVPEQYTLQTQKDIVDIHPNHGTMNIDVVSFPRLAYRVFEELSYYPDAVLEDMGKRMVLRKILEEEKNQLKIFGSSIQKPGFVENMKSIGLDVYMLTGDNIATARAVAAQVGIEHVEAGVLPADKASFVSRLQREGKVVAMVGDGINDSAALAQADVSIAMGHGSDIAMDVASMTIISGELTRVSDAVLLSRKTVRTIRENLFWAFIYNIIGIPIAAGILYPVNGFLLNPMIASAAMALSSVSVVANSLRLRWRK